MAMRSYTEIIDYMDEAFDKAWLMRNCDISAKEPFREVNRKEVEFVLNTYDDIPEEGYSDWECGYWNGILGALQWVLGNEKNFLDS